MTKVPTTLMTIKASSAIEEKRGEMASFYDNRNGEIGD